RPEFVQPINAYLKKRDFKNNPPPQNAPDDAQFYRAIGQLARPIVPAALKRLAAQFTQPHQRRVLQQLQGLATTEEKLTALQQEIRTEAESKAVPVGAQADESAANKSGSSRMTNRRGTGVAQSAGSHSDNAANSAVASRDRAAIQSRSTRRNPADTAHKKVPDKQQSTGLQQEQRADQTPEPLIAPAVAESTEASPFETVQPIGWQSDSAPLESLELEAERPDAFAALDQPVSGSATVSSKTGAESPTAGSPVGTTDDAMSFDFSQYVDENASGDWGSNASGARSPSSAAGGHADADEQRSRSARKASWDQKIAGSLGKLFSREKKDSGPEKQRMTSAAREKQTVSVAKIAKNADKQFFSGKRNAKGILNMLLSQEELMEGILAMPELRTASDSKRESLAQSIRSGIAVTVMIPDEYRVPGLPDTLCFPRNDWFNEVRRKKLIDAMNEAAQKFPPSNKKYQFYKFLAEEIEMHYYQGKYKSSRL
ncbi:MAG: hypothetical protein KDK34_12140, partial [Leptospiraceae bacterium]|nr:hypothetical protein [Leptospiraceae bacterium]